MNQLRPMLMVMCLLLIVGITPTKAAIDQNDPPEKKNRPVFTKVVYEGQDQVYKDHPLQTDEFYNPILQGCYPDPAITRKGDDYYMVCSSFAMFPGVPIFHSQDLVNWTQLGYVLDRPSQLRLSDSHISGGIYAPGITYNEFNDTFYMITTSITGGLGNFVVKTKDPRSGWSDPIKLDFGGIDPAIFFDDTGKGYVVHNDAPPQGTQQYNGHRVIKIWEYDVATDQVIPGSDKIIVDGGVDITEKPIWIEGPHLYKKGGKYYLMCAEGGTGGWHSEVIFTSDSPYGPFSPAPSNPILTQRYLAKDRKNKVDWAGHADLVEGPGGQYYGVFLAVRPNEKNRVNTGRETFILPVDWSGTYPVFENGLVPIEPKQMLPAGANNQTQNEPYFPNGNFTIVEEFDSEPLDHRWIALRGPREDFIKVTKKGLELIPLETHIKEMKPTAILFHRQQHMSFTFTTTLEYTPSSEKDLAGITCLQNEGSNYVFGLTKVDENYVLLLERNEAAPGNWRNRKIKSEVLATETVNLSKPIQLRVTADGDDYRFSYSNNGEIFRNLGGTVSGDILSTDVAGGFTGAMIGLYATANNSSLP